MARIYNGIYVDSYYHENDREREHLLFLGRVSHAKGTADAITIAKNKGLKLKIAGKVDEANRAYFDEMVKPELDNDLIEFLGEVSHEEKIQLLREAICALYPIAFEKPFGLVMAEALASGTPVIALKRGSVPEVLDSKTGVVGSSLEELLDRFDEVFDIDSNNCVSRAKSLFGKERMVDQYEVLYKNLKIENNSSSPVSWQQVQPIKQCER